MIQNDLELSRMLHPEDSEEEEEWWNSQRKKRTKVSLHSLNSSLLWLLEKKIRKLNGPFPWSHRVVKSIQTNVISIFIIVVKSFYQIKNFSITAGEGRHQFRKKYEKMKFAIQKNNKIVSFYT